MNYRLSAHAREELDRRQISLAMLEDVLSQPEQKVPGHEGILCYQSRVTIGGKPYLLRVMVNEITDPLTVVTIYRTSKIAKYWNTL